MTTHSRGPHLTLCVGLDPQPAVLEAWGLPDSESGLKAFVRAIVPVLESSRCEVVKPQVAFFERFGVAGMRHLAVLLGELRSRGIFTIGDAKRGDIDSTMSGYAQAWLTPGSDFETDAVTLVPYQGLRALEPALTLAGEHDKKVFVLAATSNPQARETQMAIRSDGRTIAHGVVDDLWRWVEDCSASADAYGVVVGATVAVSDYAFDLRDYPGIPVLAPGFGHQGAVLSDAHSLFPETTPVTAVVARSVLLHGEAGCAGAIEAASAELSS